MQSHDAQVDEAVARLDRNYIERVAEHAACRLLTRGHIAIDYEPGDATCYKLYIAHLTDRYSEFMADELSLVSAPYMIYDRPSYVVVRLTGAIVTFGPAIYVRALDVEPAECAPLSGAHRSSFLAAYEATVIATLLMATQQRINRKALL